MENKSPLSPSTPGPVSPTQAQRDDSEDNRVGINGTRSLGESASFLLLKVRRREPQGSVTAGVFTNNAVGRELLRSPLQRVHPFTEQSQYAAGAETGWLTSATACSLQAKSTHSGGSSSKPSPLMALRLSIELTYFYMDQQGTISGMGIFFIWLCMGFPGDPGRNASACNPGDLGSVPRLWRSPGEGNGNPLLVLWPGRFHRRRSLVGYSPWDHKESHTTGQLHFCTKTKRSSGTGMYVHTYSGFCWKRQSNRFGSPHLEMSTVISTREE